MVLGLFFEGFSVCVIVSGGSGGRSPPEKICDFVGVSVRILACCIVISMVWGASPETFCDFRGVFCRFFGS